jgi:alpha/beta superfamily hydrolase
MKPAIGIARLGKFSRTGSIYVVLMLVLTLGACGKGSSDDDAGEAASNATVVSSGTVAVPVPGAAANAPAFVQVEDLQRTAKTIREKVSYLSSGLQVNGLVCRPNELGRFPILMYQHGGFSGVGGDASGDGLCQYMADRGYAVFMSSYRGEDGSQGRIEYCGGEVDDSLQLLAIARTQAYVSADEIAVLGLSHGACISLQMVARGVPATVVVDVFGPTEWSVLYEYSQARALQPGADPELTQFISNAATNIGTPANNPDAYRSRSPLYSASALSNFNGSILVVHGARDEVVPPKQSCDLVRAIGGFRNSHLSARYVPGLSERTVTSHPNECGAPDMPWVDAEHPGKQNWQGQRHFVFYDEMSHIGGIQLPYSIDDAENFIRTKLPGGRRN